MSFLKELTLCVQYMARLRDKAYIYLILEKYLFKNGEVWN
ncbi:hypothetical protein QY97_02660 [Bacillus thermotolerans]|uniref:Uncharacterized protein n=1 Tax=Bacillus thermotolerans TaxID=1221996 RepID=A0A0F5HLC8_BACTR|nr:hypothetical protein QY97_02660 [Bacillus thermotolerans]KKB34774.1 hypothetical protein QY96_03847 [Bacillus thermotolerans]KKB41511.1 hypothetical protein QY95_00655 [Bacillus thermotolerans]